METKEHKKIESILPQVAFTGSCSYGKYGKVDKIEQKILAFLADSSVRYICVAQQQELPENVNGEEYKLFKNFYYAPNSKVLRSVWVLRAESYDDVKRQLIQLQNDPIFDPVNKYMRRAEKDECRIASDNLTISQAFVECSKKGKRRVGAIMLVNEERKLSGIYTDSDLTKLLEKSEFDRTVPDISIKDKMIKTPFHIFSEQLMWEALPIIANRKISELPVLDENEKPIGMLDITDLFGIFIEERRSDKESSGSSTRKENEQSQTSTH